MRGLPGLRAEGDVLCEDVDAEAPGAVVVPLVGDQVGGDLHVLALHEVLRADLGELVEGGHREEGLEVATVTFAAT